MKFILATLIFLFSSFSYGQEHIFKFILPTGVGSASSIVVDILDQCFLKNNLKIIKEFKPGGDGIIAINALKQSTNTSNQTNILFGTFGTVISGKFTGFDPINDVENLIGINTFNQSLVSKKGKYSSIEELKTYSRNKPLNIGSSQFRQSLIPLLFFLENQNIAYQIVSYKNASTNLTDLLGENIDLSYEAWNAVKMFVDSGSMSIIVSNLPSHLAKTYNHKNYLEINKNSPNPPYGSFITVLPSTDIKIKELLINTVKSCQQDKDFITKLEATGSFILKINKEEILKAIKAAHSEK